VITDFYEEDFLLGHGTGTVAPPGILGCELASVPDTAVD
jgi:hypothetical protein